MDRTAKSKVCHEGLWSGEFDRVKKGNGRDRELGAINHYARSLEKYGYKARTWRTASGEGGSSAATNYDIAGFLARNVGWLRDAVALRYSCQLREVLRRVTGETDYLRPGSGWYRNAEFGKHVSEPEKRGRYGRPNPDEFIYLDGNPFHYHGGKQRETHLRPKKKAA